jgi:HEAT repeat protein
MLEGENRQLQTLAADALGLLADPQAVTALCKTLDDSDSGVRGHAAAALGSIGTEHPNQITGFMPALLALLSDPDPWIQVTAAEVLGDLGKIDPTVAQQSIPRLLDTLKLVEKRAAFSLIERAILAMGLHARPPLTAIAVVESDSHSNEAQFLLKQIADESAHAG